MQLNTPRGPAPRTTLLDSAKFYTKFLLDPLGVVGGRFDAYGDAYYVPDPSGKPGLFVFRHPDHMRDVLIQNAASYGKTHSGLALLSNVLGNGLLNSDGDVWKRQRRLVQPAFSRPRLVEYADAMTDETLRSAKAWRAGETIDVNHAMMELTLRVVCRTLFSHDVTGSTSAVARGMSVLQEVSTGVMQRMPAWIPNPQRARFNHAVAAMDGVVNGMVHARRQAVAAGEEVPADLLQALVTAVDSEGAGDSLSEREVRDQLVTLFLAGHETTSHALTWTLYLLSQHPREQRKVREEIARVLGDRPARYEDIEKLTYTEQVFKEALRLYPPAPVIARGALQDNKVGEYDVPRGSEVVLWLYFTHRDPRWFPDPHTFKPERFAPENEAKLPKLAYLPFGAGSRACIGKVFAMIEGILMLTTLLQQFRFELEPGQHVTPRPRVTLGPKRAVRMTLRAP